MWTYMSATFRPKNFHEMAQDAPSSSPSADLWVGSETFEKISNQGNKIHRKWRQHRELTHHMAGSKLRKTDEHPPTASASSVDPAVDPKQSIAPPSTAASLNDQVAQAADMLRALPQPSGMDTSGTVFEDDRAPWWDTQVQGDASKKDFYTLGVQKSNRSTEARTCIEKVNDALDYVKRGESETKKVSPSGTLFELPSYKQRPTHVDKCVKVAPAREMRWEPLVPAKKGHLCHYEYSKCVQPVMKPVNGYQTAEYYLRRCIQVMFELYVATSEDETISAINCDLNSTSQ